MTFDIYIRRNCWSRSLDARGSRRIHLDGKTTRIYIIYPLSGCGPRPWYVSLGRNVLPAQQGNQNLESVMIQPKSITLKQVQKSQYFIRGVAKVNLLRPATWPPGGATNRVLRHL